MSSDYFYDGQIRRYILQFMRIFSDFKYEVGPDGNGISAQKNVPVIYGDPSWQAANILNGNTQNAIIPCPLMSCWVSGLQMAPERRQDPMNESTVSGIERELITNENLDPEYTTNPGNRFTIQRYMPVPYTLTMQLDLLSSNTTTKLQILEQILTIFNPGLQLQQNDNYFDWSNIFEVELQDIVWTSRTMPQSGQEKDVASLVFTMGIWINPPAKFKKHTIIEQIVTNIYEANNLSETEINKNLEDPVACVGDLLSRVTVTPGDYGISIGNRDYEGNELVLLTPHGVPDPDLSWTDLFSIHGKVQEGVSQITLLLGDIEDYDNIIVLNVNQSATKQNVLEFTVDEDTIPASTLPSADYFILPSSSKPGLGIIPNPLVAGNTAIILDDISTDNPVWINSSGLPKHSIAVFDGTEWSTIWDPSMYDGTEQHIDANLSTGLTRYVYNGSGWNHLFFGEYPRGTWRLSNLLIDNDVDPTEPGFKLDE